MKRFIIHLFSFSSLLLLLGISACEDVLNQAPISNLGSNGFYRNADDFNLALAGAYSSLRSYPQRQFDLFEVRSDNIYSPGTVGRDHNNINNFVPTLENSSILGSHWNQTYAGIVRVNTVLEQLSANLIEDEDLLNQFSGEARFLRALYYFDLIRSFGGVPLVDRPLSPEEALEVGRSTPAQIYDALILPDLILAIEQLPEAYAAQDLGRATSWAARALLARVYLTRSGPDYGISGPGLGANEYAEALTLLEELITDGPFGWVEDYASIFSYTNENNPDIVFDVQLISGGQGAGSEYPALQYPQNFGNAMGFPYAGGTSPDGDKEVSVDLVNSYDTANVTDLRRSAFMLDGWIDPITNSFIPTPFVSKFLDISAALANADRFDFGINFPVIRYTDVLLMRAEALLQTGGSQTTVDELVNQVRSRSGIPALNNVTYEELMEERRREFAGEGLRWHDLVRSGLVKTVMDEWLSTGDSQNQMPETLDLNFVIYPIPFNQIDVKLGLYEQNPGY